MRRTTFLTTVLAGGVRVLGGCGSDGGDAGADAGSSPADSVKVTAAPAAAPGY